MIDSTAFCYAPGDVDQVKEDCDALDGCVSFEFNAATGRAFFNQHVDSAAMQCSEFLSNYVIQQNMIAAAPDSLEGCKEFAPTGTNVVFAADTCLFQHEQLTPDDDYTYFHATAASNDATPAPRTDTAAVADPNALMFTGIEFASGGTFKVCYCDSSLLPSELASCTSHRDFTIEVGTVHSSGVSCLIREPRFQRNTCVDQGDGSLRCWT